MFWLGTTVSLCYVPGVTGAYIATQWPVLSILLPFALWRSGPVTPFHWLGLLFIAYATARVAYSPIPQDGVYGLWLICIRGLSFWLGSTLDDLRGLYAGLAAGAAVSSAIAVLEACGYSLVAHATPGAGLYVNSVAQGLVLSLIAVALVSERMWLWVPPLLPGIMLSGSRGAWLALAVGLASKYVRGVWIFIGLGAFGIFLLSRSFGSSDELRLFIWNAAAHNLTWLGWGPGAFFSWVLWYDNNALYPEYAHNDALQLAFEYGTAAIVPIGIFAFVLTRNARHEWPVVVAFVVAGCYSVALWVPVASFLACVVAGRIVRDWAMVRNERHSRRFDFVPRQHRTSEQAIPVVAGS